MKSLIICLCLLCLGCMPRSIAQLKAEYPEPYRFTVDKGYQEEYRALMDYCDRCFQSSFLLELEFRGNLYTDKSYGEITVTQKNLWDRYYHLHIISSEKENKTEVSVYGKANDNFWGKKIESGDCP